MPLLERLRKEGSNSRRIQRRVEQFYLASQDPFDHKALDLSTKIIARLT